MPPTNSSIPYAYGSFGTRFDGFSGTLPPMGDSSEEESDVEELEDQVRNADEDVKYDPYNGHPTPTDFYITS